MELKDWINVDYQEKNKKDLSIKKQILSFFIGVLIGFFLIISFLFIKEYKFVNTFYFKYQDHIQHIINSYQENNINFSELEIFYYLKKCNKKEAISLSEYTLCISVFMVTSQYTDDLEWITFRALNNYYEKNKLYEKEEALIEFYLDYKNYYDVFCHYTSMKNNMLIYFSCENKQEFLKHLEYILMKNKNI